MNEVTQGSVHYDYTINLGGKFFGKLIFDVRMSQRITFKIEILKLSCDFNEDVAHRKFFYNYTLTDNKTTVESGNSKTVINKNLVVGNKQNSAHGDWLRRQSTSREQDGQFLMSLQNGAGKKFENGFSNGSGITIDRSGAPGAQSLSNSLEPESARKVSGTESDHEAGGKDIFDQMRDRRHIQWRVPSPPTNVS